VTFSGEFEYRVDEKGRVPLPPKYRLELRAGVVLTRGYEKCIRAYPLAAWGEYAKSVAAARLAASKRRRLNRFIFGSAYPFEAAKPYVDKFFSLPWREDVPWDKILYKNAIKALKLESDPIFRKMYKL